MATRADARPGDKIVTLRNNRTKRILKFLVKQRKVRKRGPLKRGRRLVFREQRIKAIFDLIT